MFSKHINKKNLLKILIIAFFSVLLISQSALLINGVIKNNQLNSFYKNIKPISKMKGKFYNFKLLPSALNASYNDQSITIGKSFPKINNKKLYHFSNSSNEYKQSTKTLFHNFKLSINKEYIIFSYIATTTYFPLNNKVSNIKVTEYVKRNNTINYFLKNNNFIKKLTKKVLILSVNNFLTNLNKHFKGYYNIKVHTNIIGKINYYCATTQLLSSYYADNANPKGMPRLNIIESKLFNFINWPDYIKTIRHSNEINNVVPRTEGHHAVIVRLTNLHFSSAGNYINISYPVSVKIANLKGYNNNYLQVNAYIKWPNNIHNSYYINKIKNIIFKRSFFKTILYINNKYTGVCNR